MADKMALFRDPTMSENAVKEMYDDLPVSIQAVYSRLEFAWLTDAEKANLLQHLTEPEF